MRLAGVGTAALVTACGLVAAAVSAIGQAAERLGVTMADGSASPGECLFVPGTIVPRLVIGVRRLADEPEVRARQHLELLTQPRMAAPVASRHRLYKPLFVYAERADADGRRWCLLGVDYAAASVAGARGALGWVDAGQVHFLDSRYAYHFRKHGRVRPIPLYRNEADAYRALASESQRPPELRPELAIGVERMQPDAWDPLQPAAIPPFVEMTGRFSVGLTDTTPTFPLTADNHLIRLGAVLGGPVDQGLLEEKRKQAKEKAGLEILFVIDDTLSMEQYFPEVAKFIEQNLSGGGDATELRIAVSWYRDREDDSTRNAPQARKPYEVSGLQLIEPAKVVAAVRAHKVHTIKGDGAQPWELMGEGLEAAIATAGFTAGANAMVFVIGDYGDRAPPQERAARAQRIAKDVAVKNLQMAFIQVGDAGEDTSFRDHADDIRQEVRKAGGAAVQVESATAKNLQDRIATLQREMQARRSRLEQEIEDLKWRNPYSEPGAAMGKAMLDAGMERAAFDRQHLQIFTAACGWLYDPTDPEGDPQLRELIFLALPEAKALSAMLAGVQRQLGETGRIDADAALDILAERLASHPRAGAAIRSAWEAMPDDDRSLGVFLRDAMGIRVRSPVLYRRDATASVPATVRAIEMLGKSKEQLDLETGLAREWYDSWRVTP